MKAALAAVVLGVHAALQGTALLVGGPLVDAGTLPVEVVVLAQGAALVVSLGVLLWIVTRPEGQL